MMDNWLIDSKTAEYSKKRLNCLNLCIILSSLAVFFLPQFLSGQGMYSISRSTAIQYIDNWRKVDKEDVNKAVRVARRFWRPKRVLTYELGWQDLNSLMDTMVASQSGSKEDPFLLRIHLAVQTADLEDHGKDTPYFTPIIEASTGSKQDINSSRLTNIRALAWKRDINIIDSLDIEITELEKYYKNVTKNRDLRVRALRSRISIDTFRLMAENWKKGTKKQIKKGFEIEGLPLQYYTFKDADVEDMLRILKESNYQCQLFLHLGYYINKKKKNLHSRLFWN